MNANKSAIQLFEFLEARKGKEIELSLRPQGDSCIIDEDEINLCIVKDNGNQYFFGGISEAFYDAMVKKYDWRQQQTKDTDLDVKV